MRSKLAMVMAIGLVGAGCVPSGYYHRVSDGLRVDQNAAVLSQFEVDKTVCMGEVARVDAVSRSNMFDRAAERETVLRACLAQKGYIVRQ